MGTNMTKEEHNLKQKHIMVKEIPATTCEIYNIMWPKKKYNQEPNQFQHNELQKRNKKFVNLGKEEKRRKGYYSAGEDIADPEHYFRFFFFPFLFLVVVHGANSNLRSPFWSVCFGEKLRQ